VHAAQLVPRRIPGGVLAVCPPRGTGPLAVAHRPRWVAVRHDGDNGHLAAAMGPRTGRGDTATPGVTLARGPSAGAVAPLGLCPRVRRPGPSRRPCRRAVGCGCSPSVSSASRWSASRWSALSPETGNHESRGRDGSSEVGLRDAVAMTRRPLDQLDPVAVRVGEPASPRLVGAIRWPRRLGRDPLRGKLGDDGI
jgi:hypothetical protein